MALFGICFTFKRSLDQSDKPITFRLQKRLKSVFCNGSGRLNTIYSNILRKQKSQSNSLWYNLKIKYVLDWVYHDFSFLIIYEKKNKSSKSTWLS